MKKKTINLIKTILRYAIPAVIGWFEGDTHAVTDGIMSIVSIFI